MAGKSVRTILAAGALIMLSALLEGNIFSSEAAGKLFKGAKMDKNMGLSIPEGLQRATFALG